MNTNTPRTPPMPTNKPEVVLPELPEPDVIVEHGYGQPRTRAHSDDQLRTYGQACIDTLTRPADGEFVMVPKEPTGDMLDAMIAPWLRGAGTERECLTAGWKGALSAAPQQHGQEVVPADVVERYGVPIYEVDFGEEGKERYVLLSDFNTVVTELEQPQQPAGAVDIEGALDAGDPNWRVHRRPNLKGGEQLWFAIRDIAELRSFLAGERSPLPGSGLTVVRTGQATPPPAIDIGKSGKESGRADNLVSHMVQRFLGWRLPENFGPDCGIKFERLSNVGTEWERQNEPTGTNLLDAEQARAMFAYCIEGHDAEEDYYVIQRLSNLLAQIAVAINGPEPPLNRWSYHDLPEKVRALKTIDIGKLRELVSEWRESAAGSKCYLMTEYQAGCAAGLRSCTDELAALIGDGEKVNG